MLADYAQVADGKLTVVGAGWTQTGPVPGPFAIAALLAVPWTAISASYQLCFELIDQDGYPVMIDQGLPLRIEAGLDVDVSASPHAGEPAVIPFALNMPPLPLGGGAYSWVFSVDGQSDESWRLGFRVVEA